MITLSELWTYPLKSAKGISLNTSTVNKWGLAFDRSFMLVDPAGFFLSQRQTPQLATIEALTTPSQQSITFQHPLKTPLFVDPLLSLGTKQVTVWQDTFMANSYKSEINDWFSDILNTPCELVSMKKEVERQVDTEFAKKGDITAFSDGFPLLLISQASLDDLNQKLNQPVGMERFRPNLVVTGCKAFEEDTWQKIQINGIILDVVKPCSRCIIPNTNQQTGARTAEPLKTLSSYRKGLFGMKNKVFFGQNVIQQNLGKIQLGDKLIVLE